MIELVTNPLLLIVFALGAYRLTRVIVEDVVFESIRNRIWKKFPPERTKLGYWLTCYWCASFAVAALMLALYLLIPFIAIPVFVILALSAVVGFIDHLMTR